MKTLLLLLLSCLPLCAATTYTVLSDNTNRTIAGGTTNLSLLNATNQVFTGTNTFPAASFYPANMISVRLLVHTNAAFIGNAYTNAAIPTNAGDFALCAPVATIQLPALLGSNSAVRVTVGFNKTNTTTTAATVQCYVGSQTNWIGQPTAINTGVFNYLEGGSYQGLMKNNGSMTNQFFGINASAAIMAGPPAYLVDTSAPWPIYFGLTTVGIALNVSIKYITIEELVR